MAAPSRPPAQAPAGHLPPALEARAICKSLPFARARIEILKGISVCIGSGELVQTLIQHDLVDAYRLMIHPLVLGTGKRLFRDGTALTKLRLVDSKPTTTGVLILTYEPEQSTPA